MTHPRAVFGPFALLLAVAGLLGGCSVRPTYQVRVQNDSSSTVAALLRRDRPMQDDETLAQARIGPGEEATLGPVEADPLDPVELLIARPEDMQTSPRTHRLSRGQWHAVVGDASMDSWHSVSVQVNRD